MSDPTLSSGMETVAAGDGDAGLLICFRWNEDGRDPRNMLNDREKSMGEDLRSFTAEMKENRAIEEGRSELRVALDGRVGHKGRRGSRGSLLAAGLLICHRVNEDGRGPRNMLNDRKSYGEDVRSFMAEMEENRAIEEGMSELRVALAGRVEHKGRRGRQGVSS